MARDTVSRRYDLDWLRIGAILIVFLYHSSRFFNLGDWHVKNVNTFVWVEMWNVLATLWLMPLFFVVSGASLFYSIPKSGDWSTFYSDKFLRLMIPVLFASITHAALQVYLERLSHGIFSGSFFSFIPEYFYGVYQGIGSSGSFAFHGVHLWYLFILFFYSLICYRLFVWLAGSGRELLDRITMFLTKPGWIYLMFSIPLLMIKVLFPMSVLSIGSGGWGFLYYIWFLIAGFMIISSERLQELIKGQRWVSFGLAIILTTAYLSRLFGSLGAPFPDELSEWLDALLWYTSAWCWIFTFLGFGIRFLNVYSPILRSANEGVLPFFILHQTVLLGIGYFVMQWKIHDALKWMIVLVSSFVVILAVYVLLVRKFEGFRFLFGMKTSHSFFEVFRRRKALVGLPVLYLSLIGIAVAGSGGNLSPMPLAYDPEQDVLLNSRSVTKQSSTGVQVVNDEAASKGQAIMFESGAKARLESQPDVFVDITFSAPAGPYTVWLRGKSNLDSDSTDSLWLQLDDEIGTRMGVGMVGNWNDIHPAGSYAWASNADKPVVILLSQGGDHRIRLQPRQTPHRVDQIWLSRSQPRIPDTGSPIK